MKFASFRAKIGKLLCVRNAATPLRRMRHLTLSVLSGGLLLLSHAASATDIPVLNFTSSQSPLNATTTCVGSGFYANGWTGDNGYWQYELNTTGYTNINMTFSQTASNATTGPKKGYVYYYEPGTPEVLFDSFAISNICTASTIHLPTECEEVSDLFIRVRITGATAATATHRITASGVFDGSASASCSTVTAGTLSANAASVCNGSATALNLTGFTVGAGITYQWQSSDDNGTTWADIDSASGFSYTTPALQAATQYRVIATCSNGPVSDTSNVATVNVVTVNVNPISGVPSSLLTVGDSIVLSNSTPDGVWSSSNTGVATINNDGELYAAGGGTSFIKYVVTDASTFCQDSATATVNVVWPNTLALYAGYNGTSTGVLADSGAHASDLTAIGFGYTTPCGSGGLSGLRGDTAATAFDTANAYVSYKVYPNSGNVLNVTRIHVGARVSANGPQKARIAYRVWTNGQPASWVAADSDKTLVSGNCGASANSWDFNTGNAANPNPTITGITDSLEVAVFPFAMIASTGVFQLNSLEVYGIVTDTSACNLVASDPATDSVLPALSTICDSGYRYLNYNVGAGGIIGEGISYQWQHSADGSNWTDIDSAIGAVYQTSVLHATGTEPDTNYYRVKVSCQTSGDSSFSAPAVIYVTPLPDAGSIALAPADAYLHIGTPYTFTNGSATGGFWSSNDTSVLSVDSANGAATPHIPGDAVISYVKSVNGCSSSVRDTINVVYPNTIAAYIGKNGRSSSVNAGIGFAADSLLSTYDTTTRCGNGGLSGLTNNGSTAYDENGPHASFVLTNNTGNDVTVTGFHVTARRSNSGIQTLRLAYNYSGGFGWVDDNIDNAVDADDCGYSVNVLSFDVSAGLPTLGDGETVEFAVYGYDPVANGGTLQINSIDIVGTGASVTPLVAKLKSGLPEVQIYPNPARNILNVNAGGKEVNVRVLGLEGRTLLQVKSDKVNVASLSAGMYLIEVYDAQNGNLLKTTKFAKE